MTARELKLVTEKSGGIRRELPPVHHNITRAKTPSKCLTCRYMRSCQSVADGEFAFTGCQRYVAKAAETREFSEIFHKELVAL